jgi:hypothetical protein
MAVSNIREAPATNANSSDEKLADLHAVEADYFVSVEVLPALLSILREQGGRMKA